MPTPTSRKDQIKNVFRVASGNFLEMYDFTVYGYYAAAIGRTFRSTVGATVVDTGLT